MGKKKLLLFVPVMLLMGSCKLFFPNTMLKTGKDFKFSKIDSLYEYEYKLQPADQLDVKVYSNNGYELVDVLATGSLQRVNPILYTVKPSGYVDLPLIDSVYVAGSTVSQARAKLRDMYSYYFIHPFIIANVYNRRAVVYSGSESPAEVTLSNENMNILVVIALGGGVKPSLRADKIKLIRGDLRNPKVFLLDLSTIEGMRKAATTNVQPNDVIYIEPSENAIVYIEKISQTLSALLTIYTIYTIVSGFRKP